MDWKKIYSDRKCTAEEAVKSIKSGDRVAFAHAVAEPPVLVDAMVANAAAYKNVEVCHMVTLGKGEYSHAEYKDNFRFNGWFTSPSTRKSIEEGHGDFTPVFFHEVPSYIRNGTFAIDVFMVMVSPPDEHGYCCVGVSSDYTMQAIKSAKIVLAEVNDQVPVVYGETFAHVSEFDKIVETSHPLPEIGLPKIGEVELAIGKNCASLIEDGSTLQLGIGAIPDAVLQSLKDKKDLGIHSEMISDGVVDLYEAGVINCSKKGIDNGKMTVTFLMGTKRLYDFAANNPIVEMRTVDYVNHPCVVAQSTKLVCINGCLSVDFMGQVVSDSIGTRQFSGVGGQVDFCRGAAMSLDGKGKNILAMPSVAKKKDGTKISKIVPFLDHGAAVTTSRHDVHYIVTEYGIALLKGKTLKERARALIAIAHPDFREELKVEFEKRFNAKF
ncbi:acetyl-CoA hydrolase/transferase family protein [Anaerovorax odorimutans]|uniref:acetyl-CoA hydrolase/transferase family protein n=1 Tax=Anaerovorax odorimutans TaxID=109327 RepID=UPI000417BC04|nr:acetyl-CoA hydrolase/transferase C-terminal domain-containing protein [Anaerovorax odorimutans]